MTATEQQDKTKENAAAAGFVAAAAMTLGGPAAVIAAIAVGVERALGRDTPERRAERARRVTERRDLARKDKARRRQAQYEKDLAALAAYRAERRRARAAHRAWIESGADPDQKPATPSRSKRAGAGLRRHRARLRVGRVKVAKVLAEFREGYREGHEVARKVKAAGGSLKQIATARPGLPGLDGDKPPESTAGVPPRTDGPEGPAEPKSESADRLETPRVIPQRPAARPGPAEPNEAKPDIAAPNPSRVHPEPERTRQQHPTQTHSPDRRPFDDPPDAPRTPSAAGPVPATAPAQPDEPHTQEEPMETATLTPVTAETNAEVIAKNITDTRTDLDEFKQLVKQMQELQARMNGKVKESTDLGKIKGAEIPVQSYLDELGAVTGFIGEILDRSGDVIVEADNTAERALTALQPTLQHIDGLRRNGGSTDMAERATAA